MMSTSLAAVLWSRLVPLLTRQDLVGVKPYGRASHFDLLLLMTSDPYIKLMEILNFNRIRE